MSLFEIAGQKDSTPQKAYASGGNELSKLSFVRETGSKTLHDFLVALEDSNNCVLGLR